MGKQLTGMAERCPWKPRGRKGGWSKAVLVSFPLYLSYSSCQAGTSRMRKEMPRFLERILLSTPALRDPYKEHSTLRGCGAQVGS